MTIHTDPNAAHAVYAPSSAHRWTVCTASAEAISRLPEQEEGEEAAKGTAAHEEIERVLGPLCASHMEKSGPVPYPESNDVDPEHPSAYGVALVVDYVRQLVRSSLGSTLWIEQRVALTDQIWGRCDVAHWDDAPGILTIVDYKDGYVGVDAEENEQLRIYAAGTMFTRKLPVKWIRYVIVQPNDFRPVPRVKQWHEPVESLYAWAGKIASIPGGPKSFVAGEQCTYCPLFGMCEASRDVLSNIGALVAGLMRAEDVRPEQRALFLTAVKPITDAFKNADKAWTKAALSGDIPPGMGLFTGKKDRVWKNIAAAREAVIAKGGIEALELPSPAQAEKLGVDVSTLAETPPGGPVLAFANDKRKPWKPKTAAEMFANVPGVTR
jgi:hypothetical protein